MKVVPFETIFSIIAYCAMGLMLLIGGYGLYSGRGWGLRAFLISQGALFYSLMIAIGYYGQRGESIYLGMFAAIFTFMAAFLAQGFRRGMFKNPLDSA